MPPNACFTADSPLFTEPFVHVVDESTKPAGSDWNEDGTKGVQKVERIVDKHEINKLRKKSDQAGILRFATNLSILATTVYLLTQAGLELSGHQDLTSLALHEWALIVPLYMFLAFQVQCFAFAAVHELTHRNMFASKLLNDVALFTLSVLCFEVGEHERIMHKQHHIFTNNVDKDPELTSFHSKEELQDPNFRIIPKNRSAFFRMFWDVYFTFSCRVGRLINSALGIPVDYSGWRWNVKDWELEPITKQQLQRFALAQVTAYATIAYAVAHFQVPLQGLSIWWFAPVLLGYPMINFVRNLEHANCEVSKTPNSLRNTRTVRSNLLVRVLLWDTNFHAEHHAYPMVPFHNLHKLHEKMSHLVVNNETKHFTTQNWAAIRPGGWIDAYAKARKDE